MGRAVSIALSFVEPANPGDAVICRKKWRRGWRGVTSTRRRGFRSLTNGLITILSVEKLSQGGCTSPRWVETGRQDFPAD